MKRGAPDHPKMRALQRVLALPRYAAVGVFESLIHFAAQYAKRGDVGKWSDREIASALEWERSPEELIDGLVDAGFVDRDETFRLLIHDWADHADQTVSRSEEVKKNGFAVPTQREKKLANASATLASASEQLAIASLVRSAASQPTPTPTPEPTPTPTPTPTPSPSAASAAGDRGGGDDGGGDFGGDSWEEAKETANAILKALRQRPPDQGKYRRLIIQAAYLSLHQLDEEWLQDAIEDTRRKTPRDTWSYFRACLASGARARGHEFDELLARTEVPAKFLRAPRTTEEVPS